MNRTSKLRLIRPLATVLAGIAVLAVATSANAVLITNLTTKQVIFSDNFESGTLGAAPTANVGSWELVGFGAPSGTHVVDAASPGPNQGDQYLELHRQLPPFYPDVQVRAHASAVQSNSGDIIRLEFSTYQSSYKNQSNTFIINPAAPLAGREYFVIGVDLDGNPRPVFVSGADNAVLSSAFKLDKWQNWTIDFELGTNNTTWTLDGTTTTTTTPPNGTHVSFEQFVVDIGGDDIVYLDSHGVIPEPSTLVTLGIGAIGLIASRMRRRK